MKKQLSTLALGLGLSTMAFAWQHWDMVPLGSFADFGQQQKAPTAVIKSAILPAKSGRSGRVSKSALAPHATKPLPVPVLMNGSGTACQGDSVMLTAPAGYDQYLWSNGATTRVIYAKTSGHYTVRVGRGGSPLSDTLGGYTNSGVTVYPIGATDDDSVHLFVNTAGTCSQTGPTSLMGANEVRLHSGIRIAGTNFQNVVPANDGDPTSDTRFLALDTPGWWVRSFRPTIYFTAAVGQAEALTFVLTGGQQNGGWFPKEGKAVGTNGCEDFVAPFPIVRTPIKSPFGATVNIIPAPVTPAVTASGSLSFCAGGSVWLKASGGPSGSYIWSNGASTDSIRVTVSGTYSVRSGSGACISVPSQAITVSVSSRPLPVNITTGGPTAICNGDSVLLSAPAGYAQYLWSNGATTQAIHAKSAGHYWVTVANVNGCFSDTLGGFQASGLTVYPAGATVQDSIYLFLNPNLTCPSPASASSLATSTLVRLHSGITIGGNQWQSVIAANDVATEPQTRFSQSGAWWTKSLVPASYYNSAAATAINFVLAGGPTAASAFDKEGKVLAANCPDFRLDFPVQLTPAASPFAVDVSIAPPAAAPIVSAVGPLTFCQGGRVVLYASGAPAGSYRWSDGSGLDSLVVTTSGSYDVRSFLGACTSLTSAATVVNVTPGGVVAPSVAANGPTTFCAGGSVVLEAATLPTGQKYRWSTGDTTQSIVVTRSGSYTVVSIDGACASSNSTPITVSVTAKPLPAIVTASGATNFCAGDSVRLSAPAGFAQYLWSNGATTQNITVRSSGRYTVRVANANGCLSDTLNGFNKVGAIWVYPGNATDQDSVYLFVNPNRTCPSPTVNAGVSLVGANLIRLHSGATVNGQNWSNLVSTTDVAVEPSTRFEPYGNWFVKRIAPRSYYGVAAVSSISGLNFVLNGGAPANGWFEKEGKDESANCGDFFVALPVPNIPAASPFGVDVVVQPQPSTPSITFTGPTTFCYGQSITLRATGSTPGSYIWSDTSTADTLLVTMGGNYTVRSVSGTCSSPASSAVRITVTESAGITIMAMGNTNFCNGDSVVLMADNILPTQTYRWSNGATTRSITAKATANYSVRVFDNGCGSAASNAVAVVAAAKPLPVMVTAAGPTSICVGDSVSLSAPTGYNNYLWSNGATTRTIQAKMAGNYTVRVGYNASCLSDTLGGRSISGVRIHPTGATANDSVYLFVTPSLTCPLPAANAAQSLATANLVRLHSGATVGTNNWQNVVSTTDVALEPQTRFAQVGGMWVKAIKPSSFYNLTGITGLNFVLTGGPRVGGWFEREGKVEPGCGDFGVTFPILSDSARSPFGVTVTFNPTPSQPSIAVSGPTTFCNGNRVILRASGGATGSYVWSNGAVSDSIIATVSGTYSVRSATGACSSVVSSPVVVSVTASPAPNVIATGDTTFCAGRMVALTTDSVAGARYQWSNGDTTRTIRAKVSGRYAVRLVNNGCVSAYSDSVTVNVLSRPLPVPVSALGSTTVCAGDSVRLIAPSGYSTYLWSNGATSQQIDVKASGHYTVRVGNANGCISDTLAGFNLSGVTVYPAGATAEDSIYLFLDPRLTCPLPGANNSLSAANIARLHSGINKNGTRWSNVVNTTVVADEPRTRFAALGNWWAKALRPRSYYAAADTDRISELCFVLNGGAPVAGWFEREGKVQPGCSDFFVPLPVPTTTMASPFGVTVTVRPVPTEPVISPAGTVAVCSNSSLVLDAGAIAGARYRWSNGDTTQTTRVRTVGNYTVSVIIGGCTSLVSRPVSVGVTAAPNAVATVRNDTLFATPAGASYQWLTAQGLPILGANTQTYKPSVSGGYQVIVTRGSCADTSAVVQLVNLANFGSQPQLISLYPNPASGLVHIIGSASVWETAKEVLVYNVLGRRVLLAPALPDSDGHLIISLEGLAAGTYQIQIPGTGFSRKLVVQ